LKHQDKQDYFDLLVLFAPVIFFFIYQLIK